ncbi:phosphotyrosine protein phosphatase [Candidatus Woesearchaeota archaeon]|nr:phosphotyrosine protein phosphatase [Candidatus Woesearchaeota archaeon]
MKILFICNQNENRSKTAEEIFKEDFKTKSAGLYNKNPVTERSLLWADIIIVMEDEQRTELARRFPEAYLKKQILNLNIPDIYKYNDFQLIAVLKEHMAEHLYLLNHS